MKTITHLINSRPLTAFAPLTTELVFEADKNYLFDLSYLSGLQVIGERAEEFLQGQLSCDLHKVTHERMQQGALCNLKGRVLALTDVVHWKDHGLQLILPADLLSETQTAMFSRVTLKPTTDYQVFGFYFQNPHDDTPFGIKLPDETYGVVYNENYCCYCLEKNVYILLVNSAYRKILSEPFIQKSQWRGSLAWHQLQIQQKRIEIYPESRGLFLPHRLELQLSGYISFTKGCYKGQEIIARTQYRAKIKHELKIITMTTNETLKSGQSISSPDYQLDEVIADQTFLVAASVLLEPAL